MKETVEHTLSVPSFTSTLRFYHFRHSVTDLTDGSVFDRHCHDHYELLYVVRGRGRYVVEGVEYPMESGTLLLLRPYEYHYVCPDKGVYERCVINFGVSRKNDLSRLPLLQRDPTDAGNGLYFSSKALHRAIPDAYAMLSHLPQRSTHTEELTEEEKLLLSSVVMQVLYLLSFSKRSGEELYTNHAGVTAAIRYINLHLDDELSLEELSRECFVSKYYLCRAFRACTGSTVGEYITAKRIAKAKHMIERGESASTAALAVGYCDYSAFFRAYRKVTGEAPVRERKRGSI